MEGYTAKVIESSKELSAKEKIQLKDTTNAHKLDEVLNAGALVITPEYYAVIGIHNEKSDNKDYNVYVIVDTDGEKYVTGSDSFWSSFKDIFDEMAGENETYQVEIYKVESKNYKGKSFITCSIR